MSDRQPIAGLHSVRTALKHGAAGVREVLVDGQRRDGRLRDLLEAAQSAGVKVRRVGREELDRLLPGVNHQGVIAWGEAPAAQDEGSLRRRLEGLDAPPFLLVLDGVQDPHNLGACLRTADAAGVHAVIAPKDRSCGLTPAACKVACGAAERLPFIQVTNLVRTLAWLRNEIGVWTVGAAGEAEQGLFQTDLKGPLALVLGAEEDGLRRLTRESCDLLVHLPMRGSVESLNVSVATGICLYEALRQRMAG